MWIEPCSFPVNAYPTGHADQLDVLEGHIPLLTFGLLIRKASYSNGFILLLSLLLPQNLCSTKESCSDPRGTGDLRHVIEVPEP